MFSAIGTVAVTVRGSSNRAASTVVATTAAAPAMSDVMWSMWAAGGYGGILGVGGGSSRKPRLVRLRWSGGPSPRASVALVGKGVTFDTGGISIKPAAHMDHMTSDMAGAAAVVATAVLAARLELPVAVTALVPMLSLIHI